MLNKDDYTELFELRIRGILASGFAVSNVLPNAKHWKMLRGETDITMRDIGEINHITNVSLELHLMQRPPREDD